MYLWTKHFHYCGKAKQSVKEKRKGRKKVGRSLVERVGDEKREKKIKEWEQDQIMCWEKRTHRHCLLLWFSYFVSFYISTSGPTIHLFSCFLLFYTFSFLPFFFFQFVALLKLWSRHTHSLIRSDCLTDPTRNMLTDGAVRCSLCWSLTRLHIVLCYTQTQMLRVLYTSHCVHEPEEGDKCFVILFFKFHNHVSTWCLTGPGQAWLVVFQKSKYLLLLSESKIKSF